MEKIDPKMTSNNNSVNNLKWIDLKDEAFYGQVNKTGFYRLDDKPYVSPNVDLLRRHPSGINLIFKTDSSSISIKASLLGPAYMPHMTSVATIGFDLYYKHKNKWIFLATTKSLNASYEINLVKGLSKKEREYRLYFPLYQEVKEVAIGIDTLASIQFIKEVKEKLIIYGTSISQGGCASRPGLSYGALLGRWLDLNIINLGFSGSAHMEDAITEIINDVKAKYLILELEANNFNSIQDKLFKFINKLNSENIILISHFPLATSLLDKNIKKTLMANNRYQKELDKRINFVDGKKVLKHLEYEETVDGVHLNDLGFYALAKYLQKVIRNLSKGE